MVLVENNQGVEKQQVQIMLVLYVTSTDYPNYMINNGIEVARYVKCLFPINESAELENDASLIINLVVDHNNLIEQAHNFECETISKQPLVILVPEYSENRNEPEIDYQKRKHDEINCLKITIYLPKIRTATRPIFTHCLPFLAKTIVCFVLDGVR